jgi:hypothetical protein
LSKPFYRLYEPCLTGGPRIVRLLSLGDGEKMVREKRAEQGVDADGATPCFCLVVERRSRVAPVGLRPVSVPSTDLTGMQPSEAVFDKPEMDAIAGTNFANGKSRTAKMNEFQREQRQQQIFATTFADGRTGVKVALEDKVERSTNKLKAWAQLPALLDRVREEQVA